MTWTGTWRNQFGSIVRITDDADGHIEGVFETALADSGFYGAAAPITGSARGNCISFAATCTKDGHDMVVSYTGLLRDGRMETLWFYAADSADDDGEKVMVPWWKAMITNADTFDRIDDPDSRGAGAPPGAPRHG